MPGATTSAPPTPGGAPPRPGRIGTLQPGGPCSELVAPDGHGRNVLGLGRGKKRNARRLPDPPWHFTDLSGTASGDFLSRAGRQAQKLWPLGPAALIRPREPAVFLDEPKTPPPQTISDIETVFDRLRRLGRARTEALPAGLTASL